MKMKFLLKLIWDVSSVINWERNDMNQGASSVAFPGALVGSLIQSETAQVGLELALVWDAGISDCEVMGSTTLLALELS